MAAQFLLIAAWLAEGAVNHAGGAIMEQQLNDLGINKSMKSVLKEYLRDAVEEIKAHIDRKFLEDNLNDALADVDDAQNQLLMYKASGSSAKDLLEGATQKISSATSHLAQLGAHAFDAYPMAVGIQLNVHEERIKQWGEREQPVVATLIQDIATPIVMAMKDEWELSIRAGSISPIPELNHGAIPIRIKYWARVHGYLNSYSEKFRSQSAAQEYVESMGNKAIQEFRGDRWTKMEKVIEKWEKIRRRYA